MKKYSPLALTALLLCSPMLLPTGRVHGADVWEDILEFLGLMHSSHPKHNDVEITTGGHDLAPTARQGPERPSSFTLDSFATGSDREGSGGGEPLDTYQTPEPSTLLLCVVGGAAAAAFRSRRRRRKSGSSA